MILGIVITLICELWMNELWMKIRKWSKGDWFCIDSFRQIINRPNITVDHCEDYTFLDKFFPDIDFKKYSNNNKYY